MSRREQHSQPVSISSLLSTVQRLAKEDPDAFVLFYFQATELLVALDPAGYEYLMAGVMLKTFRESGFLVALEQLQMRLDSGDVPGALERLDAIRDWSRRFEDLASQERLQELLAEHEKAAVSEPTNRLRNSYLM